MTESAEGWIGSHRGKDGRPLQADRAQREAICHFQGPCEVIAGPGSGKTFVLVQRILRLIRDYRIDPSHILVMTFSSAAAREMRQRFLSESVPERYAVFFGTFHSVFFQILRESSGTGWKVISPDQQRRLLQRLAVSHHVLSRIPAPGEMDALSSLIARTKVTGRFPSHGSQQAKNAYRGIYEDYQAYLTENHLVDFEDMGLLCRRLLMSDPVRLHCWQERFTYLLVDEFQDINEGQFAILRLLAGERGNLFVVGDDDQSIYRFRGSDPAYMLKFPGYYPGAKRVELSVNYRSRPEIVRVSGQVIRENRVRIEKTIRPGREDPVLRGVPEESGTDGDGERAIAGPLCHFMTGRHAVWIHEYPTQKEEYDFLCRKLRRGPAAGNGCCAVILRTHTQMKGLIRHLQQEKIPFRTQGRAEEFHDRTSAAAGESVWKVLCAYYRAAGELERGVLSRAMLLRIMNEPERFLLRRDFRKEWYSEEELCRLAMRQGREAGAAMKRMCSDLHLLRRLSPPMSVRYLLQVIKPCEIPGEQGEQIVALAQQSGLPDDFLQKLDAAGYPDGGNGRRQGREEGGRSVRLLTMHACKGLEFDTVFLPDLNEGILPSRRARGSAAVEEERRLLYVAMTRAREELYLLYLRGDAGNPRRPCRFLEPLGIRDWTN